MMSVFAVIGLSRLRGVDRSVGSAFVLRGVVREWHRLASGASATGGSMWWKRRQLLGRGRS